MRLHIPATLDLKDYQRLGVTKADDLLILKYPEVYRDKIRAEMRKIVEKNAKNEANGKKPVELEVDLNIHYAKRSMSANAWLWAAHTLEARLVNTKDQVWKDAHGITWYKTNAITPEEIHEHYMEQFAPLATVLLDVDSYDYFKQVLEETTGRFVKSTLIPSISKYEVIVRKTSSYMNVAEFCALSEHVKSQLMSYGIDLENSAGYTQLLTDLEGIKSRAVKDEEKIEEITSTGTDDIPTLLLRKDSVSIVKDLFNGEEVNQ